MPRIRSIKPQFWTDEKVGELPMGARLLFIGTWNLADDEGILIWNASYLKGQLFTYDEKLTMSQVNKWMDLLEKLDLIKVYDDARKNKYGFVRSWHKHQKINRPQPSAHTAILEAISKDNSLNAHEQDTEDSSLEKEEGKEEGLDSKETNKEKEQRILILFDRFWAAYPKKKSKGQAEKTFIKLAPDEQLMEAILAGIERAKKSDDQWRKNGGQYIPHPATWLNARGWEDEISNNGSGGGKRGSRSLPDAASYTDPDELE